MNAQWRSRYRQRWPRTPGGAVGMAGLCGVCTLLGVAAGFGCDVTASGSPRAEVRAETPSPVPEPAAAESEALGKAGLEALDFALAELDDPEAWLANESPAEFVGEFGPGPAGEFGPRPAGEVGPEPAGESFIPGDPPPIPPCVDEIREFTHECVEGTRELAEGCVEEVTELFQSGQPDAAIAAAQACTQEIGQHSTDCLVDLRGQCRACIMTLFENGAPMPVLDAALRGCARAAGHVLHARRGAVGAVGDAVDRGVASGAIHDVRQLRMACVDQNRETTDNCVAEIEALLEAGEVDQAIAVGAACIQEIRAGTADCVLAIQERCQSTLQGLTRNCADGRVLRELFEACARNARWALDSAFHSVRRIHQALPPPPDGGGA